MAVKLSIQADSSARRQGILGLRGTNCEGHRFASLGTTVAQSNLAGRGIFLALMMWGTLVSATTYYVSSSGGSDGNSGTSVSAAWQTIAHVNGQTFQPGDSILFRRGDVWNESLVPGSSGSSGNPIAFDAYGTGAAPNLTGYYAVPLTAWVLVTGNAWKAAVPATYSTINFCLFGSVWGQKVTAATSNLTARWDFYLANGFVYVYSVGNPANFYNEAIVPMALSNVPVVNVNGKSWLTFQHFLVNWFDQYGVYVQGASDHLVFANMEADSMIPQGTQPLGFYVNESSPGPGDIKIYNAEAHLNYDGFRFDGAATAITMVNDKGYGNRDGALVDDTGGVFYSYCHFYASSLAVAGSTDVEWTSGSGPIQGVGNVAQDVGPAVQVYQRYPAEVTLTVDDAGMTPGADTYYSGTVLPIADAAGVPVGAAITVGYALAQTLVPEFQGWVTAGRDVTSHSMSHTYYTNTDALEIQYTGSGTAATMSISGKTLTITVTGAADSVSYNLAQGQAEGTIKLLRLALLATGKFTATEIPTCQGPYGTGCSAYTEAALLGQDLADVSGQDVRSGVYHLQMDVTRLTTDEITLSRQWMTANLTGLPSTPVYVYPGGYETTAMQGITEGVPYVGARGALKEDLGVSDTYADGFNVQNITSFGVNPSWMGLPPASLNQKIQALVWKESVWGVPWGIFWHLNELSNSDPVGGAELTNLIQDFKNSGATIQTNTGLVNWLLGGTQETGTDGNSYYVLPATSMVLDFRPTKNSPVVDAGQNLGAAYELDINGVNQNSYGSGWEIGAHVYEGYGMYGGSTGGGRFSVGTGLTMGPPNYEGSSASTANPGTISVPIASHSASGTVYTGGTCGGGTGKDVCWVSGDNFSTFVVAGTPHIFIGSPAVSYLISSVDPSGLHMLIASTAGTQGTFSSGVSYNEFQSCIGQCQNTTWFTSINPTSDPYTRITDGGSIEDGQSVGDFTSAGGDNTLSISANETYLASQQNGGDFAFYQLGVVGNVVQVLNPGLPVIHATALTPAMSKPFSFDYTNDSVFYGNSGNKLYQWTITNINSLPAAGTLLVDWVNNCPGIPAAAFSPVGVGGSMIPTADGNTFSVMVGQQGNAVWVLAFDKRFGCAAVNFQTGAYWNYCTGTCNSGTPATGTLSTTGFSCWGANVIGSNGGIHDIQGGLGGAYVEVSIDGTRPWLQGFCAGNPSTNQVTFWQVGTANTFFADDENNSTYGSFGSHQSVGFTNVLTPYFAGYNSRPFSDVSAGFTTFLSPALNAEDAHYSWFHKPGNVDTLPWIGATDSLLLTQGSVYSPPYPSNLVVGLFTNTVNGAVKVFGPTYSCGPVGVVFAHCTGNLFDTFGAAASIGVVSPQGHFFCFATSHFLTQGLDNTSTPRVDVDCIYLQ